jgi:ComF family protein
VYETALDFVFPPVCIVCGRLLERRRSPVCDPCWHSIPRIDTASFLYSDLRDRLRQEGVDDLVSTFVFEKGGAFQHIAHALKYQSFIRLGEELGSRLGAAILAYDLQTELVMPVPLHRIKLRERGFNQAESIARGVARVANIPLETKAVRRKRHTRTQTLLSIDERRENMADAFASVRNGLVEGKSVLLVDDVITTGSTTSACARALRNAGAARIIAASAALAVKDADRGR